MVMEVALQKDGTLQLLENGKTQRTAVRSDVAHAKGLAEPTDPLKHTSVKDPTEPFQFRFPDLNGNPVSNTDAKFRGKVVLVNIMEAGARTATTRRPSWWSFIRSITTKGWRSWHCLLRKRIS